jgi:hypothetical protein
MYTQGGVGMLQVEVVYKDCKTALPVLSDLGFGQQIIYTLLNNQQCLDKT